MVGGVVGGVDADDANGVVLLPPSICPNCKIFVERSKQVEVVIARVGVVLENRHFSKIAIFLKEHYKINGRNTTHIQIRLGHPVKCGFFSIILYAI
jgi:hypothetical protein